MAIQKDILIVGGGPIGIACALECKKQGLDYVIIEKGALTNSLFNYPLNMSFFSTSEKLEIDHIPFISNNPKPNRNEALEYYRRVATSNELQINLYEAVLNIQRMENQFLVASNKQNYNAKKVVIATGFYDLPKLLNVPGEDLPKVSHYYKEAHPYSLQDVIIVGASNSAVDAALEIWQKGGNVTMVIRGKSIGERVKYWVRPNIMNRIKEGSIKVYYNANIKAIKDTEVIISTPTGDLTLANDNVLALTGYTPNFKFIADANISFSTDEKHLPTYNPESMETNVKGIYLAGVICGGRETHKWFIENSRIHAKLITNHISKTLKK